jgi:hypothetical protein
MADDAGLFIHLYLDEDVHESIAPALRQRGYDAVAVREVNRRGLSDTDQLAFAVSRRLTVFSFNASDYVALHVNYVVAQREHAGIVISRQLTIGETLRRLLVLLDRVTAEEMRNQLRWLP